ncbi:MAG: T9SS type A sorting domain-containing protein [Chlorobi bacterium]|nr:T9SS type A sorting domain-containing protein [Chlorobiota bacterium]MCI0715412.1 T9SS type A sorting domain-containing protein [Chlorobiota bacterium]
MTKIRFDITNVGTVPRTVRIIIFGILGREITTLVNEQLQPGTYEVNWDASNYPSGVYYYKLIAGDYSDTKKMILLK